MSYKVRFSCRRFSLLLANLLFCLFAFPQKKAEPIVDHRFDVVDQLFKQNQKALGNDYIALVWKDDKIIYQKQGSADFTAKTPAPIVSAANWMTAALVMTFVDEGKLSLDDKVTQYIPLFGKYSKGYITIRNCLTNTTGIKVDEGVKKALEKSKYETLEDEVNSFAAKRDIGTNPGTEFFYSNLGPNIAARVLEIISKKSFDRLMQDRILRPLKLHGTSFSSDGGAINPAGGAHSTANDFISFLTMLMNKGMFGEKRILSEKAVAEMETAQFISLPVKYVPKELQGAQFGLGNYIMGTGAGAAGTAAVLSCPNGLGTTPYIDKCRNYAAILIVAKPGEEKKPLCQSMMNLINEVLGGDCK